MIVNERTKNELALRRFQSNVTLSVGNEPKSIKSQLVPPEFCRKPNPQNRIKRDFDGAAKALSKAFPMNILSHQNGPKKKNRDTNKKQLTWSSDVDHESMIRTVNGPRRLSLQEKIDLYTERPDLDLVGIMERLEAIKRLEMASMARFRVAGVGSGAGMGIGGPPPLMFGSMNTDGSSFNGSFVSRNQNSLEEKTTNQDQDQRMDDQFEEEEKADETEMPKQRTPRYTQEESKEAESEDKDNVESFYDARTTSVSRFESETKSDGPELAQNDDEAERESQTIISVASEKGLKTFNRASLTAEYRQYWLQNRKN